MKTKCPIAWKKEDGPFPCAFKDRLDNCSWINPYTSCVPNHILRYNHSIRYIPTKCPDCGVLVDNTFGNEERGIHPLCHSCSKKWNGAQGLADHIRGDY